MFAPYEVPVSFREMALEETLEIPSDYNWYPDPPPEPSNEEYVEEYYDSNIE